MLREKRKESPGKEVVAGTHTFIRQAAHSIWNPENTCPVRRAELARGSGIARVLHY